MSSQPVWIDGKVGRTRPPLSGTRSVDVCVVGAGVAGMSTALRLSREGLRVVVLDDGPIAGGETERTTAHLSNALDEGYERLESLHGAEGARLAAESHTQAIQEIAATAARERIACRFEWLDGFLFLPPGEDATLLDRELVAAHGAGLTSVELLPRAPLASFETGPCLRYPAQAQLDPMRYLMGLVAAFERLGGEIATGTHVTEIEDGTPCTVKTVSGATVTARAVVVATNTPVNDRFAIHTKQAAYRTYVIAARVPRGAVARALYWDTSEEAGETGSTHYARLALLPGSRTFELLIVGGRDHRTGEANDADERFAHLESWTRSRFPVASIHARWSGQVMEPVDGLAFIGRNPGDENVFVVTGDSGHGMTHGTIAGILLTDLIQSRENAWTKLYDPSRRTLKSIPEYVGETVNTAAQYIDWVTPRENLTVTYLTPGGGAVVRVGGCKIAAYRDDGGTLHQHSAMCPHLGGLVRWNSYEKTFDCPCHGSRFDAFGEVLNGPANVALSELPGPELEDAPVLVAEAVPAT